jgi:hypothetical protein
LFELVEDDGVADEHDEGGDPDVDGEEREPVVVVTLIKFASEPNLNHMLQLNMYDIEVFLNWYN